MLMACNCSHSYQDEHYGPHVRVHNPRGGKYKGTARCTVCGTIRPFQGEKK
jgi:hypothetical protein